MGTMREEITAAIEASEAQDLEDAGEKIDAIDETPTDTSGDVEGVDEPEALGGDEPEASVDDKVAPAAEKGKTDTEVKPTGSEKSAPVGWKPEARESWAALPDEVKKAVAERESTIGKAMQDTADARRFTQQFDEAVAPFKSLMAAEGVSDPMQAVQGLLQTNATLKMGNPQQRALKIAQMVKYYDVDITSLDAALTEQISGQPNNGAAPEDARFSRLLDERMQPFNDVINRMNANAQQADEANRTAVHSDIETFSANPENEFFNDVRMDMADLMDMAAKRGQKMPLKEAYDKAVTLHPNIMSVLDKRKSDSALMGATNALAGKENAASSIKSSQASSGGGANPTTMREQIEAAWSENA